MAEQSRAGQPLYDIILIKFYFLFSQIKFLSNDITIASVKAVCTIYLKSIKMHLLNKLNLHFDGHPYKILTFITI